MNDSVFIKFPLLDEKKDNPEKQLEKILNTCFEQ